MVQQVTIDGENRRLWQRDSSYLREKNPPKRPRYRCADEIGRWSATNTNPNTNTPSTIMISSVTQAIHRSCSHQNSNPTSYVYIIAVTDATIHHPRRQCVPDTIQSCRSICSYMTCRNQFIIRVCCSSTVRL